MSLTDLIDRIEWLTAIYKPGQLNEAFERTAKFYNLNPEQIWRLWEALVICGEV